MQIQSKIETAVKIAASELYSATLENIEIQPTRKDFEGDVTVVVFSMLRTIKGNPVEIGKKIGQYLVENVPEIADFNVVKGFLNLVVSDAYYIDLFHEVQHSENFGRKAESGNAVMVEYSSPNTNKPLHLGHVRNNLLGYSVAEILKASGKKSIKRRLSMTAAFIFVKVCWHGKIWSR